MAETAKTVTCTEVEFKPGAHLWLGNQGTLWRVLEVDRETETALLIAEKPVCERRYHEILTDITWEECDLREWLNGEYYEKTFSKEEKEAILECELKNQDNPNYGIKGGNDTRDRIFLLSIEEAEKYFKDNKDRAAGTWCWLRSPGGNGRYAALVNDDGRVGDRGLIVNVSFGVRPALKINLKSNIFQSIISSQSSESIIIKVPEIYVRDGIATDVLPYIKEVEIPMGVTSVGESVFSGCSGLMSITIPESVSSIGESAFSGCSGLTSVTIPMGVTSIGESAFSGCSGLTSVTIPMGVTSIGESAFSGCSGLMSITIPTGVTSIGESAFSECSSLTSVTIPEGIVELSESCFAFAWNLTGIQLPLSLKKIGKEAFAGCSNLENVTGVNEAITYGKDVFRGCGKLKYTPEMFRNTGKLCDSFAEHLDSCGAEELAWVLMYQKGAVWNRGLSGQITRENAPAVADALLGLTGKEKIKAQETVYRFILATATVIGRERKEKLLALLKKGKTMKFPEDLLVCREDLFSDEIRPVMAKQAFEISDAILKQKVDAMSGLPSFSHVLAAAGDYAGMYSQGYVDPKEYKKGILNSYTKMEDADRLAAALNHEALMAALTEWQKIDGPEWYAPYAAFANDEELTALIAEMKAWEKDKKLKEQIIRVRGAILLNDTVTAMRYADSLGLLERYAEMRGTDADSIRDNIISDFGLDENGKKTWTLGGKEITSTLKEDLSLTLSDESGKILKSVPKKGAEPEEYDAVSKAFSAMKKDIRSTAKTRNDKIFADFLSGRSRPGKDWKKAYLKNPVLRTLAKLIVWEQEGYTFILNASGAARDVDGNTYTVTDEPVRVAHPMEMTPETTEAWQQYFTSHGLKQPFEQVWEPVADAALVKPGRYDGCTIPLYMLMNKEKHGIIMEGQSRITLAGCSAGLRLVEGHHDWVNNNFEVTNFRFGEFTRQVNHIVVHLDKGTVAGRIKKDDISAAQWFDRFTLAQITEFIRLAQENSAVNVLAQLMEYKNEHFADFDPMDEFTLEWA